MDSKWQSTHRHKGIFTNSNALKATSLAEKLNGNISTAKGVSHCWRKQWLLWKNVVWLSFWESRPALMWKTGQRLSPATEFNHSKLHNNRSLIVLCCCRVLGDSFNAYCLTVRHSGGSRRSVYRQSTLKRRPGYRTLERDLIQHQQQQLFQIFVVVSLRKGSQGNTYSPEITQQFPKMVRRPPFWRWMAIKIDASF